MMITVFKLFLPLDKIFIKIEYLQQSSRCSKVFLIKLQAKKKTKKKTKQSPDLGPCIFEILSLKSGNVKKRTI